MNRETCSSAQTRSQPTNSIALVYHTLSRIQLSIFHIHRSNIKWYVPGLKNRTFRMERDDKAMVVREPIVNSMKIIIQINLWIRLESFQMEKLFSFSSFCRWHYGKLLNKFPLKHSEWKAKAFFPRHPTIFCSFYLHFNFYCVFSNVEIHNFALLKNLIYISFICTISRIHIAESFWKSLSLSLYFSIIWNFIYYLCFVFQLWKTFCKYCNCVRRTLNW